MLSQTEIDTLRANAMMMHESKESAARKFYDTLFELSPELRDLFPAQMADQARKFSATLWVAVNSLSDWEALKPIVEALARRHLAYGVAAEHFTSVGQALLKTLKDHGTPPDELALWQAVYETLAKHMIATAYPDAA